MTTPTIHFERPPVLAIDQTLANLTLYRHPTGKPDGAADAPINLNHRQRGERNVIWNLFRHIEAAGFELVSVWDGEESTDLLTEADRKRAAMELIFNLDDAHVYCRKVGTEVEHWLRFVLGNSPDEVLCDYSYTEGDPDSWVACVEAFNAEEFS